MRELLRWNSSFLVLLHVLLFAASRRGFITEGAATEKLDVSLSPPAVLKPDCVACSSCENPCGQVLPPPPPPPPPPPFSNCGKPCGQVLPPPPPPPPTKPTFCPQPPFCYQFGQPGSLYPYKPYDYTFSGSQRQIMQGLPLATVFLIILSYWCL